MTFYLRFFNSSEEHLLEIANIGAVRWVLALKNLSQHKVLVSNRQSSSLLLLPLGEF